MQSQLPDQLGADFELLEKYDGFFPLRTILSAIAEKEENWAGIPMPVQEQDIVIEPTYPKAKELMEICNTKDVEEGSTNIKVVNEFWSWRYKCKIVIWKEDGKLKWGKIYRRPLDLSLETLGASVAWGIEQEHNALNLLGDLITPHQMKQYLLTGMLLESSTRSGVTYLFRRLRPTVALSSATGKIKILCGLCLHPIGYYSSSWAGAMCPTDDVVAHLMLMRGDEHMFWKRSNQHPAYDPSAGINY